MFEDSLQIRQAISKHSGDYKVCVSVFVLGKIQGRHNQNTLSSVFYRAISACCLVLLEKDPFHYSPFYCLWQSSDHTAWSDEMCSLVRKQNLFWNFTACVTFVEIWLLCAKWTFLPLWVPFIGLAKTHNATQILLTVWVHISIQCLCVCVHADLCMHAHSRNGPQPCFEKQLGQKPYCLWRKAILRRACTHFLFSPSLVLEPYVDSCWFITTFSQARNLECHHHYYNYHLNCFDQNYRCYIPLGENMRVTCISNVSVQSALHSSGSWW